MVLMVWVGGGWWLVVGGVTKGYTCNTPQDVP